MAIDLGVAYLSVVASTGGLGRDIERKMGSIGDAAGKRMGGGIVGGVKGALGPIAGIAAAAAIGKIGADAIRVGVQTASGMEQARISFSTMLGSATKADSFIKQMVAFAAKTPFEMAGLQTAASSLISAGIASEKVIPIMTTLGDVTSGMGTGSEGIQRATVALQQMNAAGKITGEDLNQLRDAGIPVYDLLSAATGKSKAEIVKLAQAGKLGKTELDAMMKALETGKGLERFSGLMDKQSQSLQGMWSTLKDTFAQGMGSVIAPLMPIMKSGLAAITPALASSLSGMSKAIDGIVKSATAALKSFGESGAATILTSLSPIGLAFKAILPILPQVSAAFSTVGDQIGSTLTPVLAQIAPVVQQVVTALAGGLQQVILALLPALTQIAGAVLPVFASVLAAIIPVILQVVQAFMPLIPVVTQLITSLIPPLMAVIQALVPVIMPLVTAVMSVVQALMPLVAVVIQLISTLIPPLMAVINALLPPITSLVTEIASALVPVFEAVGQLITALMPTISMLVSVIGTIIGAIVPVVAVILGGLVTALKVVITTVVRVVGAIISFVASGIAAFQNWTNGVIRAIASGIKAVTSIREKVIGALAGAASWLVNTGTQIMAGLWKGINDKVAWLQGLITDAMNKLPDWVRKTFGIASPSKVFRKIGRFLTDGLALGITDKVSAATAALSKVSTLITKAASKSGDKAAKAAASRAEWMLKSQQRLSRGTIAWYAKQRESLASTIKDERSKLADLVKARDDMAASISGNIVGEFDIGVAAKRGAAGIASSLSSLVSKAKLFAGKLKALIAAGYPAALVQEVAGMGTAGIQAANALLSATSSQKGSIISDFSALGSWSKQAGLYVADQAYGVGIAAQQGIIAGLLAKDSKLEKAAEALADRLTKAIKKKLGIHSPSTVWRKEVGLMAAKGAALGIRDGRAIAASASASLLSSPTLSATAGESDRTRPITMDGRIVGWLKEMATGAARIVLADESLNAQLATV